MAEQELDLIEFAAGQIAKPGARAPLIMWRQLVDAGARRRDTSLARDQTDSTVWT